MLLAFMWSAAAVLRGNGEGVEGIRAGSGNRAQIACKV